MFSSGHFHVLAMRKTRKYISRVAMEKLVRQVRKASHCGSEQWRSPDKIILLLLVHTTYLCVALRAHPVHGESHFQSNAN